MVEQAARYGGPARFPRGRDSHRRRLYGCIDCGGQPRTTCRVEHGPAGCLSALGEFLEWRCNNRSCPLPEFSARLVCQRASDLSNYVHGIGIGKTEGIACGSADTGQTGDRKRNRLAAKVQRRLPGGRHRVVQQYVAQD
jgi:hypothetical protein